METSQEKGNLNFLSKLWDSMSQRIKEISEDLEKKDYERVLPDLLLLYEALCDRSYRDLLLQVIDPSMFIDRLMWVCQRISRCYLAQKDYVGAYFYLDQIKAINCDCLKDWINVMTEMRHPDVLHIMESILACPSGFTPEDYDAEKMESVILFIEQKLGTLYLEYGFFKDARKIFTKLLKKPSLCSIAREKLSYLDDVEKRRESFASQEELSVREISKKDGGRMSYQDLVALYEEVVSEAFDEEGKNVNVNVLSNLLRLFELLNYKNYVQSFSKDMPLDEYQEKYDHLCYLLYQCYLAQENFVKAYFYIDIIRWHDSSCFMDWINMMIFSGSIHALTFVEEYIDDPSEYIEKFKDDVEGQREIKDFLERALGYLYVQFSQYKEAREVFTRLLDNPASSQFAREELEYLDEIEKIE